MMYSYNPYYYDYLAHHGVKGQRWGIRRYQPYTSANKGVFKNLKRTYKSSVRSLRKERKRYEKEGDTLAIEAADKAIKDTKRTYKSELKGLKKEFKAENRANYIQDVAERGNEKEVAKVRKEMSPQQLEYAIKRIQNYKDWEKLSMRDVEQEVKYEQAMKKFDKIIKGADAVSKVASAGIQVASAGKAFKELFKKPEQPSEYEKEKQRLDLEQTRANIERTRAQAQSMVSKGSSTSEKKSSDEKKIEKALEKAEKKEAKENKDYTDTKGMTWGKTVTGEYSAKPVSSLPEVETKSGSSLLSKYVSHKTAQAAMSVKLSDIPFEFTANSKSGQVAASKYISERNSGTDKVTASWKAADSYAKSISNSKSATKDSLLNYAKAKGLDNKETATMAVDKAYSKYFNEADRKAAQAYLDEEKKRR